MQNHQNTQPATPHRLQLAALLLCALSALAPAQNKPAQKSTHPLAQSTQLVVVTTPDWTATQGHLQRYQRPTTHSPWQALGPSIPIVVGKAGLGWGIGLVPTSGPGPTKQEGDNRAPAGIFTLGSTFGYASAALPGTKLHYLPLTPTTDCVDDFSSPHYNRLLERTPTSLWTSAEHMRTAGESYRWGIVVNHNGIASTPSLDLPRSPKVFPGRGSCIFLHIWKNSNQPTVGCTAMQQSDLEALIPWLDPQRHPLLVQLPAQEYAALIERWQLPTVVNMPANLAANQTPAPTPQEVSFRITPLRPVEELRVEALKAQPPHEPGDLRKPDLAELAKLDPSIKLDVRYATGNNFLGTPLYTQARAFLQRPAAEGVARANMELKASGYGLIIHDGYRPWYVTKIFWDATPNDKKLFVANPAEGSKHNRGCAVDLSLYDLKTGKEVQMPSGYDEMSDRAYASYAGGTKQQTDLRELLRRAMEKQGFAVNPTEWWHFDYKDWKMYPILNVKYEDLDQ